MLLHCYPTMAETGVESNGARKACCVPPRLFCSMRLTYLPCLMEFLAAGMDGFYDRRSCLAPSGNPSSWAGYTGQDFLPQHAVKVHPVIKLEFCSMHGAYIVLGM